MLVGRVSSNSSLCSDQPRENPKSILPNKPIKTESSFNCIVYFCSLCAFLFGNSLLSSRLNFVILGTFRTVFFLPFVVQHVCIGICYCKHSMNSFPFLFCQIIFKIISPFLFFIWEPLNWNSIVFAVPNPVVPDVRLLFQCSAAVKNKRTSEHCRLTSFFFVLARSPVPPRWPPFKYYRRFSFPAPQAVI